MVFISVGNRTKHNFSVWCFLEVFIRISISAVVFASVGVDSMSVESKIIMYLIFFMWIWRPFYLQVRHLYYSWRDAKVEVSENAK